LSRLEETQKILEHLEEEAPDVIGAAIIKTNGLIVSAALPNETDQRMIAAMSAALLGTSKRTAEALFDGVFNSLHLELDKGDMFLQRAGRVILAVITEKEPNVGLISLQMEETSRKIKELFKMEE
jgi:hypothetical protein